MILNERAASASIDASALSRELLAARLAGRAADAEKAAAELRSVSAHELGDDCERMGFWINVYNALLLHETSLRPRSGSLIRHRGMFDEAAYGVGEAEYSLNDIEHGILRRNARAPYSVRVRFRDGDPRLGAMPEQLDPRIHFALNCGARSCPPIIPFEPGDVDAVLEKATVAYIRAETDVDRAQARVTLPGVMKLYRGDFGGRNGALGFAGGRLEPADRNWLDDRGGKVRLGFSKFDWTIVPRG